MPKINPPQRRIEQTSELVNAAHAHRVAVGWLVSREAGLDHDATGSPFGGQTMEKWRTAKNLPGMLKAFTHQAKLLYRVRSLCLQLHNHPSAAICGGPEQWWQRILEEDILAAIAARVGPEVAPQMQGVAPPTVAKTLWWMRRGVNPVNFKTRPATWALIEAVQARVFRWRPEVTNPADDVALSSVHFLNGDKSVAQCKQLLKDITGNVEGHQKITNIELYSDWSEMLNAWQSAAKEETKQLKKHKPTTSATPKRYDAVAVLIHEAVMPTWWANIHRIRAGLEDISENKPSVCKGSDPLKKIQQVEPQTPFTETSSGARINSSQQKRDCSKAPTRNSPSAFVKETSSSQKTAMSSPTSISGVRL